MTKGSGAGARRAEKNSCHGMRFLKAGRNICFARVAALHLMGMIFGIVRQRARRQWLIMQKGTP